MAIATNSTIMDCHKSVGKMQGNDEDGSMPDQTHELRISRIPYGIFYNTFSILSFGF
jgi:hypothetical protein